MQVTRRALLLFGATGLLCACGRIGYEPSDAAATPPTADASALRDASSRRDGTVDFDASELNDADAPSDGSASRAGALRGIALGFDNACAVDDAGQAWCWGSDEVGERGDGSGATAVDAPPSLVLQASTGTFTQIVVGSGHACGLGTLGDAWCWGAGGSGQLGHGSTRSEDAPTAVLGGIRFSALAAGADHTCGLTGDGEAFCWGAGRRHRLGTGETTDRTAPSAVATALRFSAIAAGGAHTCAIERGTDLAHCWGQGADGRLGDGGATDRATPVAVSGARRYRAIAAGLDSTCGIATDGSAWCWGANAEGQLGSGNTTRATTPTAVMGGLTFATIAISRTGFAPTTCGIVSDGTAWCWGSGELGQRGRRDAQGVASSLPERVEDELLAPWGALDVGYGFTCARTVEGVGYCWGTDQGGELGNGPGFDSSLIPVPLAR